MSRYDIAGSQGPAQADSKDGVLKNKLDITRLEDMNEAELVLLQKLYVSVLQDHMPPGRISVLHLKRWHKRWLGNVYDWAGQYRTVNMSKDGFPFAPAAQLSRLMQIFDTEYLSRHIPLEKSFTGFAVPYACRSRIQVDQSEFGVFRSLISHQP